MQLEVNLPCNLSIGIGEDAQRVVGGLLISWLDLPFDTQKVTAFSRIVYTGSTTIPLPTDVFEVEVKLALADGEAMFQGADSFKLKNYRGEAVREVARMFRETALRIYEVLAKEKHDATQTEPTLF